MKNVEMFRFSLGAVMSLAIIYFLIGLFPRSKQRQQETEGRVKSGGGTIIPLSDMRRIATILLLAFLASELFAAAFDRDLSKLIGINSWLLFSIGFIALPITSILLGVRDKRRFEKEHQTVGRSNQPH